MRTRLPARQRRSAPRSIGARERIDRAAYQLFSRHGIGAVGIDAVVAHAGVAKMTLYRQLSVEGGPRARVPSPP